MHNKTSRLIAILLSLAFIFALGTSVFADTDTSITQENSTTADTAATDTNADINTDTPTDTTTPDTNSSDTTTENPSTENPDPDPGEGDSSGTGDSTAGDEPSSDNTDDGNGETNSSQNNDTTSNTDENNSGIIDNNNYFIDSNSDSNEDDDTVIRYAVSAPEGETNELYLTQLTGTTCTLASAAMLIRNYIYLNGSDIWQEFGESALRSVAWSGGLKSNFTYNYKGYSISVTQQKLFSPSVEELKAILDEHPEGIVLYCGYAPHAVLLLDYEGDAFYCADPAGSFSGMRIALEDSWLSSYYQGQSSILAHVTTYWYISNAVSPVEDTDITWTWNGSTLTISGEGEMPDDGTIDSAPWARYKDYITKIVVKSGITSIATFAFYNYPNVTSVTLPETLETIGDRAFYGCESLKTIHLPDSLTEIGQYAFALCTSLTSLTIPSSVQVVPKGLCYCCSNLTTLTLDEGTEELASNILYGCDAVTSISLPASVTTVTAKTFQKCENLNTIYCSTEEIFSRLEDTLSGVDIVLYPVNEVIIEYIVVETKTEETEETEEPEETKESESTTEATMSTESEEITEETVDFGSELPTDTTSTDESLSEENNTEDEASTVQFELIKN